MVEVRTTSSSHQPQRAPSRSSCVVDLRCCTHPPIGAEAEPVAAAGQLANVADRSAADNLGQVENLRDREHRAFGSVLLASAPDPARITRKDLVFLDSGSQDRPKQPVRLRRHRHRDAFAKQVGAPFPDHRRGQLANRHTAQIRRDVLGQQPVVQVDGADPQTRPLRDPGRGVVGEFDFSAVGIRPLPRPNLCLGKH